MPKTKRSVSSSSTDLQTKVKNLTQKYKSSKKIYLIILLLGLILLVFYKKDWFIAATVSGMPITNFEVIGRMNQQYRSQTIDQIVNEKIILSEAAKNNVTITNDDLDKKIEELEKNVGGAEVLDSLLAQQGQTRMDLKGQLKIQLIIEKLYEKEATVSATEVEEFIANNKEQLMSTDSAQQITEATNQLKQQKLGTIFNEKFQQLKQAAKIIIF